MQFFGSLAQTTASNMNLDWNQSFCSNKTERHFLGDVLFINCKTVF